VTNPLLTFWHRVFGVAWMDDDDESDVARAMELRRRERVGHAARDDGARRRAPIATAAQASATIFLVLRRMRAPFIVLVTILSISVVGLMLIPGQDDQGQPFRMGLLHSFYVISYTATTIGFGEIPHEFTDVQRLWLIVSIYLSVVGWAYALGTLFALLQDRDFRRALALQRFIHTVARLSEPFVLMIGHGQTGERLGKSLDALGRRFVVLDHRESRIAALDRGDYHADVPGLVGDARNPGHLLAAGLQHPRCEAVLALSDDDEANLAVVMTAALLRPGLRTIARTVSPEIATRMRAFGDPVVINPFDSFGDHLRMVLLAPASDQLMEWLTALPGERCPPRRAEVPRGRWVVCGYGKFGQEVTKDLRLAGLDVTIIDAGTTTSDDPEVIINTGVEEEWMEEAQVATAVGLVAATDDDIQNLSLMAAARQTNPDLLLVARRNRPENEPLFRAKNIHLVLVPPEVAAHEVLANLGSPVLLRFLREIPRRGNEWAAELTGRLTRRCGKQALTIWRVRLARGEAVELIPWLESGSARLGDLLRRSDDREQPIDALALMVIRDGEDVLTPDDDYLLAPGDELLLAGRAEARRSLDATMVDEATREYVLHGRQVPSSWLFRRLAQARSPGS
jgi:voltage-gated potassium channel